tara:strand:- start:230 stop:358 length:129 start_codon:yes stop_codon:yes gene_type:complete
LVAIAGFEPMTFASLYKELSPMSFSYKELVARAGFEPTTFGL